MRKGLMLLAAAALALAGCSTSKGLPEPAPATATARPALSEEQFTAVVSRISAAVTAADKAQDATMMGERATGPFLALRPAQYNYHKVLGDAYMVPAVTDSIQESVVSDAGSYPRVGMVVSGFQKDANLQSLNFYVQTNARTNWALWSSLALMPGATVPAVPAGEGGATVVGKDDGNGMVASPAEALAGYASLMQSGDTKGLKFGDNASSNSDDPLRTQVVETINTAQKAMDGVGSVTHSFTVGEDGPLALRTEDGGAIIVGALNYSTSMSVSDTSRTVTVGGEIGAMASNKAGGTVNIKGTLTTNYETLVAFHVPAAGAKNTTITLVAATSPIITGVQNQ